MNANELRFGNYIYSLGQQSNDKGQFLKWVNYEVKVDLETLKNIFIENEDFKYSPIPLTEEWMLRFGFEKSFTESGRLISYKNEIWLNFYKENTFEIGGMIPNIPINKPVKIKYVHQLQNLYFALTGEELFCNLYL